MHPGGAHNLAAGQEICQSVNYLLWGQLTEDGRYTESFSNRIAILKISLVVLVLPSLFEIAKNCQLQKSNLPSSHPRH